jgi:hypothetical protein
MEDTKTPLGRGGSDSLQLAKGTAARLIAKEIESYNEAISACLKMWQVSVEAEKFVPANGYLTMAAKLGRVSGMLGDTLAKMKSETRQHIRVERVARESVNAASSTSRTSGNALLSQDDSKKLCARAEGGGVRGIE